MFYYQMVGTLAGLCSYFFFVMAVNVLYSIALKIGAVAK